MVFVRRNNTENNINQESENVVRKPTFSDIEIKTYKEQAIEVLNILESQGTDIYDKNRYGGMYLKNKSGLKNSKLDNLFTPKDKKEEQKPNNLNNLFNHFNNSK